MLSMFPGMTQYVPDALIRRRLITIAVAAAMVQALLQLAIPCSVNYVFRNILPAKNLLTLAASGAVLLLLYAGQAAVLVKSRLTILRIIKAETSQLRQRLVEKLYGLSTAYLKRADRGHLQNTVVQDTERVDVMAHGIASDVLPACVTIVLLCGYLLVSHWMLFLAMSLLLGPAILISHGILKPELRQRVHRFHRSFERFGRAIYRLLELVELTQILAAGESEKKRYAQQAEQLQADSTAVSRLSVWTNSLQQTVFPCIGIVILIMGGALAASSEFVTGEFISFYVAVGMLRTPFATLVVQFPRIMEGCAAMENIRCLLDQPEVIVYNGTQLVRDPSEICLDRVCFGYDAEQLLENVSLTLKRGTVVGLTGANGAGKSTLLQLLIGLERPSDGCVTVDQVPYDQVEMTSLRQCLGVVPQHPKFFDGTIRENITFGRHAMDDQQLTDAAAIACAHEFISELPEGYDTLIGDDGVRLSGGQRQRLAMARAFFGRPKFVFLDEPSNHLDKDALSEIFDNLQRASFRPGTLLISHDPAVLMHAHALYRLDQRRLTVEIPAILPAM
jgi:ATP-binding cassette, subfamily B, bacterial